jgi:hypothetical protein
VKKKKRIERDIDKRQIKRLLNADKEAERETDIK